MKTIDEFLEVIAQVFIRCTIIGVMVLLIWWGVLEWFGDFAYSVHSKIAPMSRTQFEIINLKRAVETRVKRVQLLFEKPVTGHCVRRSST